MFFQISRSIFNGKTLLRTLMNLELRKYSLEGKVLDVGGGEKPSYFNFLKTGGSEIVNIDFKSDRGLNLDLEKDALPFRDGEIDKVLMFNILEHIYNYNHLISESYRVLKPGGGVLGFVPFLINYHPDPHDYFRYTKEALFKIFTSNRFEVIEIKEVGGGPFYVNYNNIAPSLPKFFRILLFPFYYLFDKFFLTFRPKARERFPLGFLFLLEKN